MTARELVANLAGNVRDNLENDVTCVKMPQILT